MSIIGVIISKVKSSSLAVTMSTSTVPGSSRVSGGHSVKMNTMQSSFQNPSFPLSLTLSTFLCLSLSFGVLSVWSQRCFLCAWGLERQRQGPGDALMTTAGAPGQSSSPFGRANHFWALPLDIVISLLLLSETSQNHSLRFTQNAISRPEIGS